MIDFGRQPRLRFQSIVSTLSWVGHSFDIILIGGNPDSEDEEQKEAIEGLDEAGIVAGVVGHVAHVDLATENENDGAEGEEDFRDVDLNNVEDNTRSRRPAAEVRDEASIPSGTSMRKYKPRNGAPFWVGILRGGQVDSAGRHTRSRSWLRTGVTEADVIAEIEDWLWENSG